MTSPGTISHLWRKLAYDLFEVVLMCFAYAEKNGGPDWSHEGLGCMVDCSLVCNNTRVKKKDKPCKACINTHTSTFPPVCLSVFKDVRNLNQRLRTVHNVNSRPMCNGRWYEILLRRTFKSQKLLTFNTTHL